MIIKAHYCKLGSSVAGNLSLIRRGKNQITSEITQAERVCLLHNISYKTPVADNMKSNRVKLRFKYQQHAGLQGRFVGKG